MKQIDQNWQSRTFFENKAYESGYKLVAGVDEVGRGPLAGPVVAAVVVLPPNISIPGIDDSKKLSLTQRERVIKDICNVLIDWGVGIVDEKIIDQINILQATYLAMKKAVSSLKTSPHFLLVDGHKIPGLSIPQLPIIKGDQLSISIQAASIIAKVIRDRIMMEYDQQYPLYGFSQHKGYGTAFHLDVVKRHGICEIHRQSFEPIKSNLARVG